MMISVLWLFPAVYLSLLFGVVVVLFVWIAYDKRKEKKAMDEIKYSEPWCERNCRYWDECYSNNKDPDDAFRELEKYCEECPMFKAIGIICDAERGGRK